VSIDRHDVKCGWHIDGSGLGHQMMNLDQGVVDEGKNKIFSGRNLRIYTFLASH
jgi:hypothetical protein